MNLEKLAGRQMEWRQAENTSRYFDLTLDGMSIAALKFERCGGSLAAGQLGKSVWTFKRTGFLAPRVIIRQSDSPSDMAEFTPSWEGGGEIVFSGGRRFHFKQTNFWGTEWIVADDTGSALITVSGLHGIFNVGACTSVSREAARVPETPVLLLLSWYLRLLMNEEAAATAAMTACMAAV